jgi:hypothetical protein
MLSPIVVTFTKVGSRQVSRATPITVAPKDLRGITRLLKG